MLYYFLVFYVFLRQGHCAKGWKSPNTNQEKLEDCRNECAKRSNIGYFAYSTSKKTVRVISQTTDALMTMQLTTTMHTAL